MIVTLLIYSAAFLFSKEIKGWTTDIALLAMNACNLSIKNWVYNKS